MDIARIDLGTTLELDSLGPILEAMKGAARSADAVEVAAGALARVDTAALQALLVFARALEARGAALWWLERSPELRDAARVLGLDAALAIDA